MAAVVVTAPPFPDADDRLVLEPDCSRCPGPTAARECVSWGVGPTDASVFVVGEAPGAGEPEAERWRGGNWTGMAFTTRHSGRRIRRLLDAADLLEDAFFTNAVKCLPADVDDCGDVTGAQNDDTDAESDDNTDTESDDTGTEIEPREPTAAERANCREHLAAELSNVAPDVVVPAGKHATASVFAVGNRELEGFLDSVLSVHRIDGLPPVVPLLHPSYRDVWAARLGYEDGAAYEAAVAEVLHSVLDDAA